jgi:Ca-activated chloride channel homolog
MSFAWPWALLALLLAPLMLIIHWLIQRRRRRLAIRVSSVSLIKVAMTERSRWRRRLPIGLLLASLATLGIGAARPTGSRDVPVSSTSILLTLDVSRSMCSTDVPPNRLTVAQNAARNFIKAQHNGTKIGIVAFAGIAALIVPPTTDDNALLKAIDNLTTSRGTAIGLAILASIDAIAEVNPRVAPTGVDLGTDTTGDTPPSPNANFEPDTIVVLTDGANTRGVEPVTAAEQAAARHIRVYTIGFGTTTPSPPVCTVDQFGDAPIGPDDRQFGGGGGGGGGGGFGGPPGRFLEIDEPTLQKVADVTGGTYFRAKDAAQLVDVFSHLPNEFVVQHEKVEWTAWFVLVAAILAAGAVGLSLLWNRYP